jgi:DNA-binding NtrC family response regulator
MAHEILIVDDEPDIRLLIEGILRDEGYETRGAGDAESAIDSFRARRPGLVILDVWLQGSRMDGIAILETMQGEEPHVPVLTISSRSRSSPTACCWWSGTRWRPRRWRGRMPSFGCALARTPR